MAGGNRSHLDPKAGTKESPERYDVACCHKLVLIDPLKVK